MHKILISLLALTITAAAQTGTAPAKSKSTATKAKAKTAAKAKSPATGGAISKPYDPSQPTEAIFDTSMGQMKCQLYTKEAPITAANFIGLANGTKDWTDIKTGKPIHGKALYDNTRFHRVIPNFMIQGGDPLGNGTGYPGYQFNDEPTPTLKFDRPGVMAMANSGPNTNGSQFFITEVPYPTLNDHYNIFGQCDAPSIDVVKHIARVPTNPENNRPDTDVLLKHITILNAPPAAGAKPAAKTGTATKAKTSTKSKSAPKTK
jgi:peptidyl-prolyl cis-trans isomerase A (cyclophilin A)